MVTCNPAGTKSIPAKSTLFTMPSRLCIISLLLTCLSQLLPWLLGILLCTAGSSFRAQFQCHLPIVRPFLTTRSCPSHYSASSSS